MSISTELQSIILKRRCEDEEQCYLFVNHTSALRVNIKQKGYYIYQVNNKLSTVYSMKSEKNRSLNDKKVGFNIFYVWCYYK